MIATFCSGVLLSATLAFAESKNPADYPFRIHIFNRSETGFYHQRQLEDSKGEGRANLFANGEVHGIDFNFECSEKLKDSFGYETYPAKWKKPDRELIVLLPVFGKTGSYFTCDLHTDVKAFAYTKHNGNMSQETPEAFKEWMVKHDYDPEHGKYMPTKTEPQPADAKPSGSADKN